MCIMNVYESTENKCEINPQQSYSQRAFAYCSQVDTKNCIITH